MTRGKRFGLSAAQKSDLWRRWKARQSLYEIGRAFGREHSSIRCLVSRYGLSRRSGGARLHFAVGKHTARNPLTPWVVVGPVGFEPMIAMECDQKT